MDTTTAATSPDALRARMVDLVQDTGHAYGGPVEDALRTVPRHEFVPMASLDAAYANNTVITKRANDGTALSCASQPTIVALMLDQLDVRPGQRVLEIGAGTGYNAALLAHLTGLSGEVTTVDIGADVTAQARQALDTTGNTDVRVITRDGSLGVPEHGPYDRMIVTVGAWDLPPAWWQQLAPGARLVVPLRWRGQTRSIAFTYDGNKLRSDSMHLCGFVPMIGNDHAGEHTGHIDPDGHVALHWDHDQPIDPAALCGVLDQPMTGLWSGVTVGNQQPFDGVWLRMASTEHRTCRFTAHPDYINTKQHPHKGMTRSQALVDGDSLAYFAFRNLDPDHTEHGAELGAIGHGPTGHHLANRLNEHIRTWDHDRTAQPTATAYPAGTSDEQLTRGTVIDKPHTRLIINY